MKKLLIAIILAIGVLSLSSVQVHALATGEKIDSFNSQITIHHDNSITVVETIAYDFATTSHHGIYRDIPVDYHDGSTTYYLNFRLNSVTDEHGSSLKTKVTTESGNKRIRIGNPDVTVTGLHTYQISYVLSPIIYKHNSVPYLNLDIIGEGWQVPIYNISAEILLDGNAQLSDVAWYGARNESIVPNGLIVSKVGPYQGVTINATVPEGYVTKYLESDKPRLEDIVAMIWNIIAIVGIILAVMLTVVIILSRTIRTHLRRKNQIVVAQYEPPVGLSPAHIGLLQDDKAESREVTATIIDWAVKGYIKIVYVPKKGFFGSKDYKFVMLKPHEGLPDEQIVVFDAIFGGQDEVRLSDLDKAAVSLRITVFKDALKRSLTDRGYYQKKGQLFMRGTLTKEGAKEWALVDGFRLYLSVVEKDRLKFTDAPEKTPERFSELLPYAIALGVEKQWAKQFEGIDLTEATGWYSGNFATFSAIALVSDLGGSFASTVSSNTSVSSGGGVSGGGFGGGGGGSW